MTRKVKYEDIQWDDSIDSPHTIDSFTNDSYKNLANMVLNDKYDIRYSSAAGRSSTAAAFAKKKRLKARTDEDINDDGVNDVILYNARGEPVYINGYHFRPSEFLLREKYDDTFPNKRDKVLVGGYSGFKKGFHTRLAPDRREEYMTQVNDARYIDTNGASKYFIPKVVQPRVNESLYQKFSRAVVPQIAQFIKYFVMTADHNKSHAISCISAIEVSSYLYIQVIISELWRRMDGDRDLSSIKQAICGKWNTPAGRYKAFKSVISSKKYRDAVDNLIGTNWEAIIAQITNETSLVGLFNSAGFSHDFIKSGLMPTDTDVKHIPEAKAAKLDTKERISEWIRNVKEATITTIFMPESQGE